MTGPGSVTSSLTQDGLSAKANAAIVLGSAQSLTVSSGGTSSYPGLAAGVATAELKYAFEIVGPDGLVPIAITAFGNAAAAPGQSYNEVAIFTLSDLGGSGAEPLFGPLNGAAAEVSPYIDIPHFDLSGTYNLPANHVFLVDLYGHSATGVFDGSFDPGASLTAAFAIDSAFGSGNDYSILESAGISAAAPVGDKSATAGLSLLALVCLAGMGVSWPEQRRHADRTC